MNVQYFGQYLLENGYVTKEQLLEGIKLQKSINVKLGVLAIDKGYLKADQIEDILVYQKKENKPFGIIAVEKNYITQEKIDELLSIQKEDRIFLGEALVEKGYLTLEQLQESLSKYKDKQAKAQNEVSSALNNINPNYSMIIKDSIQIIQNMFVRMIDENGKVSDCCEKEAYEKKPDYIVTQKIFGGKNFVLGLLFDEPSLLFMSSRIFKKEITTVDEYASDGAKEFLNIVIGHICASLSNQNVKTETAPPLFNKYEDYHGELADSSDIVISTLLGEYYCDVIFYMGAEQ